MKQKITPTNRELHMPDEDFIVSKTDTRGRITYINRTFMGISGFIESELLGKQHNIIRHPDMPRAVFHMLWSTLKSGEEFFGYVKNLCKDGSYYWVYANITPDLNAKGSLQGYFSVRRKPTERAIKTIIPIYQEMLAIEQRVGTREAIAASTAYLQEHLDKQNMDYRSFVSELDKENH